LKYISGIVEKLFLVYVVVKGFIAQICNYYHLFENWWQALELLL